MAASVSPCGGLARARSTLASCHTALLDLNGTFMFGQDRFGPEENFAATYHAMGGKTLPAAAVAAAVRACIEHMNRLYEDPALVDDFPSVLGVVNDLVETSNLPEAERGFIAEIIARHELGRVPAAYADAIRRLSRTHRLGLVANIWSPKDLWISELKRAGLDSVFGVCVFSSDSRHIKPSVALFAQALLGLGVRGPAPHRDIVFIGDSLRCDIGGAQNAGMRTIWINPARLAAPKTGPQPDSWAPDLLALVRTVS
jgi:FMN phosphatase YigB (HAD superfamily)